MIIFVGKQEFKILNKMNNYKSAEDNPLNECLTGILILALPYIIIGILMIVYNAIKHNIL